MDRAIIPWTAENWITVVLMVALMYLFVGFFVSVLRTVLPSLATGPGATSAAAATT